MTIADENTECRAGDFKEFVLNEGWIEWGYWLGQMPCLDAAQAARLMNGLDPEIFDSLDNRPNSNDPSAACNNARRMQRLAESCGMSSATPRAWLEWADELKWEEFKVHELFRTEVGRLQADESRTPEFQAEYASAWKNLNHIDDLDREIQTWEATSATDIQQLDRKEQKIAALREKRAALHKSVFPGDSQQQTIEPQATPPSPAPVVSETVEQRRARYLAAFETEEKREKRGALQRVANSEGVDRSNMSKDINKARAARDEQKRAGVWTSQLVQDGKRKG